MKTVIEKLMVLAAFIELLKNSENKLSEEDIQQKTDLIKNAIGEANNFEAQLISSEEAKQKAMKRISILENANMNLEEKNKKLEKLVKEFENKKSDEPEGGEKKEIKEEDNGPKLTWRSKNPTKILIQLGEDEKLIDYRIAVGVAKNRSAYVFKAASLEKFEKTTGTSIKEITIAETIVYLRYVRR